MTLQRSNIGYLRFAVEDALVAHLTRSVETNQIVPAYTETQPTGNMIAVHAIRTRKVSETDNLARYVDVEIICYTYAEPKRDDAHTVLMTAREDHSRLVSEAYDAMAQANIVDLLNDTGVPRVVFWQSFTDTDEGGQADGKYVTRIFATIGATPKED